MQAHAIISTNQVEEKVKNKHNFKKKVSHTKERERGGWGRQLYRIKMLQLEGRAILINSVVSGNLAVKKINVATKIWLINSSQPEMYSTALTQF